MAQFPAVINSHKIAVFPQAAILLNPQPLGRKATAQQREVNLPYTKGVSLRSTPGSPTWCLMSFPLAVVHSFSLLLILHAQPRVYFPFCHIPRNHIPLQIYQPSLKVYHLWMVRLSPLMIQQPARNISTGMIKKQQKAEPPNSGLLPYNWEQTMFWERDLREHITQFGLTSIFIESLLCSRHCFKCWS